MALSRAHVVACCFQRIVSNRSLYKRTIVQASHEYAIASSNVSIEAFNDGSIMYRFDAEPLTTTHEDDRRHGDDLEASTTGGPEKFRSSWDAKEAGGGSSPEADYLYELGRSDLNLNIDTGQNSTNLDSLFTGSFLGHQSDIADGTLRGYEFRTFNNIVGDYYIAPRFLEAVVMHITKNFLVDQGAFDASTKIPLILGIWGGKGQGKSFQTELCFKKLGVEAVVMSAGELESERAGEPGKLIRERYRKAAELSRVRGRLSCLLINDIDAGLGHFDAQMTVNNQIATGSIMSICDNPNKVSIYGVEWRDDERPIPRIPIIVTGNDLSTVFAPLIRDGRMSKFMWEPSVDDKVNIVHQMYKDDGMVIEDMRKLIEAFPQQSLDFFGAIRAATYDGQIREWLKKDVVKGEIAEENENMKEIARRLVRKEGLPEFEPVRLTLVDLLKEGERLQREQDYVNSMRLSEEYMKKQKNFGKSIIGLSG